MDLKTVISYSLILCYVVGIGTCSTSVEEKNVRTTRPSLTTGDEWKIVGPKFRDSGRKLSEKSDGVATVSRDEEDENEDDVEGAPPDHVVPHTSHEDPEEPSTRPKYEKPGDWAKPPPGKDVPLDFVPTKLYAQVRGTHTVKRVPQAEAAETAETAEEILSAPRLREVVSKSKKNTVYTEEGYEDSAYDHAGHVRDADFHEGFVRKLDDERRAEEKKKNDRLRGKNDGRGSEDSDSDEEELNGYDDDYEEHVEESSRIEDTEPSKRTPMTNKERDEYKTVKGLWKDPEVDAKRVIENEIGKLDEDLKEEYSESEKNTENEVPENLKNPVSHEDEDEDEDDDDYDGKQDTDDEEDYEKRINKIIDRTNETAKKIDENSNDERFYSEKKKPVPLSTMSAIVVDDDSTLVTPTKFIRVPSTSSGGFTVYENPENSQNFPTEFSSTTPNYGRIFWNYYKLVEDEGRPNEFSTPTYVATTVTEAAKLTPEKFTIVPSFASPPSTLRAFDAFTFSPPKVESTDFAYASSSVDPVYSSAAAAYESWKRHDRKSPTDYDNNSFRSGQELESSESPENSYSREYENDESTIANSDDPTTLEAPKKLSYLVIVRPNNKTGTTSGPCDRDVRKTTDRTNSIGQSARPKYTKTFDPTDETSHLSVTNDVATRQEDFTVIRPPLPIPLGQVTYADFLTDPHDSPVRQTVTRESERPGKKFNSGRDRYNGLESPYDNRFSSVVNNDGLPIPQFRPGRHSSLVRKPSHHRYHNHHHHHHHQVPSTMLLPPLPMVRSSYADHLGIKRLEKPVIKFDRSPQSETWSELARLYRSIDRTIFGKRKRRSLSDDRSIDNPTIENDDVRRSRRISSSNDREKVNRRVDALVKKNPPPRKNFFGEEANRLVAHDGTKRASDGNFRREKSGRARRTRDHEDLLNESPKIAEEEINAEIESRFEEEDEAKENDESFEDSKDERGEEEESQEERSKIDVRVPKLDVLEIIENGKNGVTIGNRPDNGNKLNAEKYPFYDNSKVPENSALKYVTNPRQVPRKTPGGTEFYDSRDRYLECDEVEPDLEKVVPEKEEPMSDRERRGDEPRLRGLGDKLDCFRAKYFDENPLDNPLFLEKHIEQPRPPDEFDPKKFASRIFGISTEDNREGESIRRVSRKPEINESEKRSSKNDDPVATKNDRNSESRNNDNSRRTKERSTENRRNRRKRPETRGGNNKSERSSTEIPRYRQVTPYQRQVYEDVMGTIKNLAGMYEAFGDPSPSPSSQSDVNYATADPRNQDGNFPVVRLTERPRNFAIRGLLPPQAGAVPDVRQFPSYRIVPYRTNKVTYRTRVRTEDGPSGDGVRIGHFRTVRVHKRSVDDSPFFEDRDTNTDESKNFPTRRKINSTRNSSSGPKTTRAGEREQKPAASDRVVRKNRGSIRFSTAREDFGKNGKIPNLETAGTEDVRRKEPTFDRIQREKASSSRSADASTIDGERVNEDELLDPKASREDLDEREKTKGRRDFHDEPNEMYKIQLSTTRGIKTAPGENRRLDREDSRDDEEDYDEDEDEADEAEESTKKITGKNNYDVHENIEEDVTTVSSLNVDPTKAPEYFKLQDYLRSEAPGYSEAFAESSSEDNPRSKDGRNEKKIDGHEEDDEEESDDDDDVGPNKSRRRPKTERNHEEQRERYPEDTEKYERLQRPSKSYDNEEFSSKSEEAEDDPDSPADYESPKNSEDKDEEKTKRDESFDDGESEFHRFASRPYSPFESYDDPKYSDIGPRISKPAFYHPSFSKPKFDGRRRGEYSAESEDSASDEDDVDETSPYKFPWEHDEAETVEESKNAGSSIDRYEYPWEKRKRLAKERRKKEKARREYEKLFEFSDDDEDDEEDDEEPNAWNTELRGKRVYPWERYDVPTKTFRRNKIRRSDRTNDNVEVGTSYRPIMKYSSRYNSRFFDRDDDDDVADPREIKRSVIESIDKATATTIVPIQRSKNLGHRNSTVSAIKKVSNVNGDNDERSTTVVPKIQRRLKNTLDSASSTMVPTTTNRSTRMTPKSRTWRIASTTTKKPIRSRNRSIGHVTDDFLKSGSSGNRIATKNSIRTNNSKSSTIVPVETTMSSMVAGKIRRRGQLGKRSFNTTTTTARPARRRTVKLSATPGPVEDTLLKSSTETTTTPKSKTVEHRSKFTKEEIITKTSYPRLNIDDDEQRANEKINEDPSKSDVSENRSNKSKNSMNESVKKVSILTEETPDHIYRTEAIDKDGVKGMFVSITPNNGTSTMLDSMETPEDRTPDDEDTRTTLKRFDDSDDKINERDSEISLMQDSHLTANLLRQVPPFVNDPTSDESLQRGEKIWETEDSEEGASDENDDAGTEPTFDYEKRPNERLYYYVEK